MGFLDWFRPKQQPVNPFDHYTSLRRRFRAQGVYENVLIDVLPLGCLPIYEYDKGTDVVRMGDNEELERFTLKGRRLVVPLRNLPYEQEPIILAELRKAMPDADEVWVTWSYDGPGAERGYFAVRFPKE